MSAETVETILARAMNDAVFAESLITNAEEALAGYDLTQEEIESFKGASGKGFEGLAKNLLGERKSMIGGPAQDTGGNP